MKKRKGAAELAGEMYRYFIGYDDQTGAPSFSKFARHVRMTLSELIAMKKWKIFSRAFDECSEIRRDYLTDRALTKRFDPSFVKYLLDSESPGEVGADTLIHLEVCE